MPEKSLAQLIDELDQLIADNFEDIGGILTMLRDAAVPEEEHECWFELQSVWADIMRCKCGACDIIFGSDLSAIYNAMRHLDAELLDECARRFSDYPAANRIRIEDLRAAAKALRHAE